MLFSNQIIKWHKIILFNANFYTNVNGAQNTKYRSLNIYDFFFWKNSTQIFFFLKIIVFSFRCSQKDDVCYSEERFCKKTNETALPKITISPHLKYCEGNTEKLLKDNFKSKKRKAFSGNLETENIFEGQIKKAKM